MDHEFLKKYDLGQNTAILAEEKHKGLPKEIEKFPSVKFVAGGSAQNTLRAAQWVLRKYVGDRWARVKKGISS